MEIGGSMVCAETGTVLIVGGVYNAKCAVIAAPRAVRLWPEYVDALELSGDAQQAALEDLDAEADGLLQMLFQPESVDVNVSNPTLARVVRAKLEALCGQIAICATILD